MIFLDTETCGLAGPVVLIQWAKDDGEVDLHHVWTCRVRKTLDLIEKIADDTVVDFNGAFDWFQLVKIYNMFRLVDPDAIPADIITELAMVEPKARPGVCVKPRGCLDLMCHARKGPYQSTMDRDDIMIKRVPTVLAPMLAAELTRRIPLKDIYFARSPNRERWTVQDIEDDPAFKNLVMKFAPSSALKALAADALGIDVTHYHDIEISKNLRPEEILYAPFALAVVKSTLQTKFDEQRAGATNLVDADVELPFDMDEVPKSWCGSWPDVMPFHINHWYRADCQEYAKDDVVYLQRLYDFFGRPAINDDDSVLAHMVGAIRWSGYAVDIDHTREMKRLYLQKVKEGSRFGSSQYCASYLSEVMADCEKVVLLTESDSVSTGKLILEKVSKWKVSTVCEECGGFGCKKCRDGLIETSELHPAAKRAREIAEYRQAKNRVTMLDKLLVAGRFHASLNVIGALSGRMSGEDDFNPQGINRAKEIRKCFLLHDEWEDLNGGDIDGAEVCIAEAVYGDEQLRADLQAGKKIHAILGTFCFPGKTYDEIKKSSGADDPTEDYYSRSKQGTFALLYGGDGGTLARRVGIDPAAGDDALRNFQLKYKRVGEARSRIFEKFCSMRQPNGLGSKVEWHEPAEYIETMFGFRRYYTLENQICKALFDLAENPPKTWLALDFKVKRRDREQKACNALRSALFGAAFGIQAGAMRSAANHEIQGTCSQVNKRGQCKIWILQPIGVSEWIVKPLNIHDELQCPTKPEFTPRTVELIAEHGKEMKQYIPLFRMDWGTGMKSWADK